MLSVILAQTTYNIGGSTGRLYGIGYEVGVYDLGGEGYGGG